MRAWLLFTAFLSAAALAQPSRADQALLKSLLPLPPGGRSLIPFGDQTSVSGLPMAVGVVETERDGAEVLTFYARYFDQRGWPWSGIKQNLARSPWPSLSATLPDDGLQVTVMAMEHEGGTSVVCSVSDMDAFYRRLEGAAPEAGFPSPPGAKPQVLDIGGEGGGRVVTFSSALTPVALAAFYAERFGAQWVATQPGQYELTQQRRRWRVRISANEKGSVLSAVGAGDGP